MPGVLGKCVRIVLHFQYHGCSVVAEHPKIGIGCQPVNLHPVQRAVQIVTALSQPGHIGKNVQRPVTPVFGISLPQVFRAVAPQNGLQLGTLFRSRHSEKFILDGMIHPITSVSIQVYPPVAYPLLPVPA